VGTAGSSPVSPALTAATADELKSVSTSPASSKLLHGVAGQMLAGRDGYSGVEEGDGNSNTLPALILAEPEQASPDDPFKSAGVKEGGQEDRAASGKADIASILS